MEPWVIFEDVTPTRARTKTRWHERYIIPYLTQKLKYISELRYIFNKFINSMFFSINLVGRCLYFCKYHQYNISFGWHCMSHGLILKLCQSLHSPTNYYRVCHWRKFSNIMFDILCNLRSHVIAVINTKVTPRQIRSKNVKISTNIQKIQTIDW